MENGLQFAPLVLVAILGCFVVLHERRKFRAERKKAVLSVLMRRPHRWVTTRDIANELERNGWFSNDPPLRRQELSAALFALLYEGKIEGDGVTWRVLRHRMSA